MGVLINLLLERFEHFPLNNEEAHDVLSGFEALLINKALNLEPYIYKILSLMLNIVLNKKQNFIYRYNKTKNNFTPIKNSYFKPITKAVEIVSVICLKFGNKPYNLKARIIQIFVQTVKKTSKCRLEPVYGSILGIFSICGPEAALNKMLSNSLYRRLLFETTYLDLWKKNEVKYFALLSLLSVLASIISYIYECQNTLIRKNKGLISTINPYFKVNKIESKIDSLKYNYSRFLLSVFIGDIKNSSVTKMIKKSLNNFNRINSYRNSTIKKIILTGFTEILSEKINKTILLLQYVNLLSNKLEPLVRQTTIVV